MNKHCNKCFDSDQLFILQKCKHIFCLKCLYYFINKMNGCHIKCPNSYCFQRISDSDIKKFLPNNRTKKIKKKCITIDCPFIYITEKEFVFQCEFCEKMLLKYQKTNNSKNYGKENFANTKENINKKNNEIGSFDKKTDLISDFIGFECPICKDFYYPNEPEMVKTRQYEFCLRCLERSLKSLSNFKHSNCSFDDCDFQLVPIDVVKFVGLSLIKKLKNKAIQPNQFCCKTKNCKGFWDYNNRLNIYKCNLCEKINCFDCGAIHEEKTCEEFLKDYDEKVYLAIVEKIRTNRLITCKCGNLLFQESKSGAVYCEDCYNYICVFTGQLAGKVPPEGCGCTVKKPCDQNCLCGCIPESKHFN